MLLEVIPYSLFVVAMILLFACSRLLNDTKELLAKIDERVAEDCRMLEEIDRACGEMDP